jgi:acyl dehydratase
VDPARAAATPFGGTIAHGFLTLSLLPLLAREREGVRVDLRPRMGVNYGLNRVRFVAPVRVGRRVRLRTELLAVDEVSERVYQLTQRQTVETVRVEVTLALLGVRRRAAACRGRSCRGPGPLSTGLPRSPPGAGWPASERED